MSERDRLDFGAPADEAELRAYQRLVSQAFSVRPSNEPEVAGLIERRGLGAYRVARLDRRVAAGLELRDRPTGASELLRYGRVPSGGWRVTRRS
ncbi:MAG TPA: hypothetical protein VGL23_24035 [Chloroflexota bacterium]